MKKPHHRVAAVAGRFYPADPETLRTTLSGLLSEAPSFDKTVLALIAPHAGYTYSGSVAAAAFRPLTPQADQIERVLLLGPSHYVSFNGFCLSEASAFETPLGPVEVDLDAVSRLEGLSHCLYREDIHVPEHALETHLPFLQTVLTHFRIVPILCGEGTAEQVEELFETISDQPHTLISVSSDLSHYHEYDTAQQMDAVTSRAIEALDEDAIGPDQACGALAIRGLLRFAGHHRWNAHCADCRNSGDTTGIRDRVVGYGAYLFH